MRLHEKRDAIEKEKKQNEKKRKHEEATELQFKRRKLDLDIDMLQKADNLPKDVEGHSSLKTGHGLLIQSNALLRKEAKSKKAYLASLNQQWLTVALAIAGKFGAAGGFGTIYLYSTELFPTLIRNSAIGASSSWARAGAMLAPYVAAQGAKTGGPLGRGVPLLVCGILVSIAGLLSLLLPETLGRQLPETVEDAKNLSRQTNADVILLDQEDSSSKLTNAREELKITGLTVWTTKRRDKVLNLDYVHNCSTCCIRRY
ncbi:organic cation transporter protein [Plakobranchus ocellatus]|uniref:Organic cation transporter protein n=1 Tax=Plakobranchus ocellatus TaxID=259542 RepID=A0AAV3XQB5_9GAST|nr:organic cation transporter protein [Plakobranchus ocellatus]